MCVAENSLTGQSREQPAVPGAAGRLRQTLRAEFLWLSTPRGFRGVCLALAVAALGLRAVGLADRQLIGDEVYTYAWCHKFGTRSGHLTYIQISQGQPYEMTPAFTLERLSTRAPLSFMLIAAALKIRDNQFMFLLPAVLFGAATVGLTGWVGRVAFGWRVGLLAGLCLLVSGRHIFYSQYARYYSFMIFFSLLSYLYLELWMRMGRTRYLVYWFAASVLNVLSHFFALSVVALQFGFILIVLAARLLKVDAREKRIRNAAVLLGATLIIALGVWAASSLSGINEWVRQRFLGAREGFAPLGIDLSWSFWRAHILEFANTHQDDIFRHRTVCPGGWLLIVLLPLAIGAVTAWRRNRLFLLYTIALMVGPVVAICVVRPKQHFLFRYVSYTLPFYVLGVAVGVATVWELAVRWLPRSAMYRRPVQGIAMMLALLGPVLLFCAYASEPVRREPRDFARFLERVIRPGDALYVPVRQFWVEYFHVASPRMRKLSSDRFPNWEQVKQELYPQRAARPFWAMTGLVKRTDRGDLDWALKNLTHQTVDRGYVFYSMKHTKINLSDPTFNAVECEIPPDLSGRFGAALQAYRFAVYLPQSRAYYAMISREVAHCFLRFEGVQPNRWLRPATQPTHQHGRIWLAEGVHDLTLAIQSGAVGRLENLRLMLLPACGTDYRANATTFDGILNGSSFERPGVYRGRFGIQLHYFPRLYYPVFVERTGRYEVAVTANNDRPCTNQLSLYIDKNLARRFYFGKLDNSLEAQRRAVNLQRGLRVLSVRNDRYRYTPKVHRGPVPDKYKTTFVTDISLKALDNPQTNRP